jgi:hypothetical protein
MQKLHDIYKQCVELFTHFTRRGKRSFDILKNRVKKNNCNEHVLEFSIQKGKKTPDVYRFQRPKFGKTVSEIFWLTTL